MNEWKEIKLGELFKIKHGYAFKGVYFSISGKYIVLTPGNFYDKGGFKSKAEEKYYSGDFPFEYILKKGDILVVMTEQMEGLLGSPAIITKNDIYLHNQRLGLIVDIDKEKIDKSFIYYLFNFNPIRSQISSTANGTKVRHTSPSRIYEVVVRLPPIVIQKKIAKFLSLYDKFIQNNFNRITILEQMAKLIYDEWFVKFKFPGNEKVKMLNSELGAIPEGWEVKKISDIASITKGLSYKSENLADDGKIAFITLKCIERSGGFRYDGLKRFEGDFKQKHVVVEGDIVMAVTDMTQNREVVARVARVPYLKENKMIFSMDLVKVNSKESIDKTWLYGLLNYSDFGIKMKEFANGVNVLHLKSEPIEEYHFILPDEKTRKTYSEIVTRMYQQIDTLQLENLNLAATRDLLLPKLISGALDVSLLDIKTQEGKK